MPFPVTYTFEVSFFETASEDSMYLTKLHKSFFNCNIWDSGR